MALASTAVTGRAVGWHGGGGGGVPLGASRQCFGCAGVELLCRGQGGQRCLCVLPSSVGTGGSATNRLGPPWAGDVSMGLAVSPGPLCPRGGGSGAGCSVDISSPESAASQCQHPPR